MTSERHVAHEGEEVHTASKADLSAGVTGLFDAPHAANQAFEVLLKLGYHPDEVGILIAEDTKRRFLVPSLLTHPLEEEGSETTTPEGPEEERRPEGAETRLILQGAGAVSAAGALGGLLIAATAAVVAPGLGLLLLGPLAGLGAGFGALVGGVYAVPTMENEQTELMTRYESEVRAGKVLIHVTPKTPDDEIHIRKEWARIGVTPS